MDQQALRQMRGKKMASWFGILFFGLVAIIGFADGEGLMGFLGAVMTILSLAALIIIRRQINVTLTPYRPGKGYWYYRMSPRSKKIYLTAGQWVLILLLLLFWRAGYFNWYMAFSALFGIYYIQAVVKRRIRLHTDIDDASLFELEELGIIEPDEPVIGLYKDFALWSEVPADAKVLVLTPDRLIVIHMTSPESGERYEIRLKEIAGLGVIASGKQGQGMIITLGLADETVIRLSLVGESYQDSPEQFFQAFLRALDRALAETGAVAEPEKAGRSHPEGTAFQDGGPRPVIRHLDLHGTQPGAQEQDRQNETPEHAAHTDLEESSASPVSVPAGRRMLDF
jgi:hypothetical protein